jgi:uncharacterized membrane protein YphA (DoxX/SURF4 family)
MVFVLSGTVKLVGRADFGATLDALGIHHRWISLIRTLVPIAELSSGVCILWEPARTFAQATLVLLLVAFIWSAWRAISKHRVIACNCFGNLTPDVLGWSTVGRSVLFLALVSYLFYASSPTGLSQASPIELFEAIVSVVGVMGAYGLVSSYTAYRHMRQRRSGVS